MLDYFVLFCQTTWQDYLRDGEGGVPGSEETRQASHQSSWAVVQPGVGSERNLGWGKRGPAVPLGPDPMGDLPGAALAGKGWDFPTRRCSEAPASAFNQQQQCRWAALVQGESGGVRAGGEGARPGHLDLTRGRPPLLGSRASRVALS